MARARKAAIPELSSDDPPQVDETPAAAETSATLREVEESSGRQPVAKVYRADPETGQLYLLDELSAALVNESWMLKTYGGGKNVEKLWGQTDKYKGRRWGFLGQETFEFDKSVPFKGPYVGRRAAVSGAIHNPDGSVAAPASAPSAESIMNMGFMQMLNQMNATTQMQVQMVKDSSAMTTAAVERMAAGNRSDGAAWVPVLTALAPLLAPLISGFVARKDPVELATQIAAIGGKGAGGGLGDVEALLELAERLSKRLSGIPDAPDSETQWIGVVKDMGPEALRLLRSLVDKGEQDDPTAPPSATPRRASPSTSPPPVIAPMATSGPTTPAAPPPQTADEWTPLEPAVQHLITAARQGKDVRHVVGMLLFVATAEQTATLRELVAQEDIADTFVARFPEFAQRRVWLDEFLDELRAELLGDAGDDDDPVPPTPTEPQEPSAS